MFDENGTTLSADQIAEKRDGHESMLVSVPEWGGHVRVRTMRVRDRDQLEAIVRSNPDDTSGLRSELLKRTMCDESGSLLFDEADRDVFAEHSSVIVERLFEAAARLNGIVTDDGAERERVGN